MDALPSKEITSRERMDILLLARTINEFMGQVRQGNTERVAELYHTIIDDVKRTPHPGDLLKNVETHAAYLREALKVAIDNQHSAIVNFLVEQGVPVMREDLARAPDNGTAAILAEGLNRRNIPLNFDCL